MKWGIHVCGGVCRFAHGHVYLCAKTRYQSWMPFFRIHPLWVSETWPPRRPEARWWAEAGCSKSREPSCLCLDTPEIASQTHVFLWLSTLFLARLSDQEVPGILLSLAPSTRITGMSSYSLTFLKIKFFKTVQWFWRMSQCKKKLFFNSIILVLYLSIY